MYDKIYKKEEYYIDNKSNEIWFKALLSNQYIKDLSEEDVKDIVFTDEKVLVFICSERDRLCLIEIEDIKNNWENNYMGHIALADDLKRGYEFEKGYCYYASLWKMKFGCRIIIMRYDH